MARLIVLDYGTSALKAAMYNERFERIALESRAWKYASPYPGWMEIDGEEYWTQAVSAVRALIKKAGGAREVVAISVTGQAETMLALDTRGECLRNAIVWLDTRAQAECAEISARYDLDRLYRVTGNAVFDPVMPLVKQMWLKTHEPEVYARAKCFMLVKEYAIYRLTGNMAGEASVNCLSGYFDINKRAWDADILSAAGLDARKLPEPLPSLEVVGELSAAVREALGLNKGVRVVNGMLDQCASALGAGNIAPDMICETTGTALAIAATFDRFEPDKLPERVPMLTHALGDRYLALPNCPTAGALMEWFRDKLLSGEERAAGYDFIDAKVKERLDKIDAPVLLPHMCGRLCPRPNADLRGSLHNITLDTDRFDIARAIMEGITFLLKENVENLIKCGVNARALASLGGGARSDVWLQMKADALNLPVNTLCDAESTALGCALGAGLALHMISGADELKNYISLGAARAPDKSRREMYKLRYERYLALDKRA